MESREIKNYAPNGPEGQLSTGRLRVVQCRCPLLVSRFRDLGILEQGKYEEERKKRMKWRELEADYILVPAGPCVMTEAAAAACTWGAGPQCPASHEPTENEEQHGSRVLCSTC